LRTAREAVRTQLLTLGAGLFAAGALVYTARNFTLSRRTFELTEQGQVTNRYTEAIGQLGSGKLDVRIGGIYALERVTHDSARDHPTVMEVLTAFVREHSGEQWPPGPDPPERMTRPDVQAALTVIGRRNLTYDRQRVDLDTATLTGATLSDAALSGANFTRADLTRANLTRANLTSAHLSRANLTGAHLAGALLKFADLRHADLTGAILIEAHLSFADLTGADLTGAILTGPRPADKELIDDDPFLDWSTDPPTLSGANLTGARWPPDAVVPEGWQRDTRRGRSGPLRRAATASSGAPPDAAPGT
jgi:hypothetical protein